MSEAEEFLEQMSIVDGTIGYTVMLADAKKAVSLARKESAKEIKQLKETIESMQNEIDELEKNGEF